MSGIFKEGEVFFIIKYCSDSLQMWTAVNYGRICVASVFQLLLMVNPESPPWPSLESSSQSQQGILGRFSEFPVVSHNRVVLIIFPQEAENGTELSNVSFSIRLLLLWVIRLWNWRFLCFTWFGLFVTVSSVWLHAAKSREMGDRERCLAETMTRSLLLLDYGRPLQVRE